MARYILAVEAAERIADATGLPLADLVDVFADIPAADVAPVVRCMDCQFWENRRNECESWEYCKLLRRDMPQDAFCSCGERRADDGTLDV